MSKTINLVGVLHDWELWRDYTEWILDNYSQAKTVLIELDPSEQKVKHAAPFFSGLESVLKRKGKNIIRSDTGRRLNTEEYLTIQRKWEDVEYAIENKKALPPHSLSIAMGYININIRADIHNVLSKKRDKEFLKNTIDHEPDLVILGSRHTDYLRRHLPNTYYVRFEHDKRTILDIFRPEPDICIQMKDIEGYAMNKLTAMGKLS